MACSIILTQLYLYMSLDLWPSVQVPLTAGTVNRGSARTPVDFTGFKAGGNTNSKRNQGLGGTNHRQELVVDWFGSAAVLQKPSYLF